MTLERLNAVDLVARTSVPAAPASFARTTLPDPSTESTLPFEVAPVDAEVSCVNLSPEVHPVPAFTSSLVFGELVQIPTLPSHFILNNGVGVPVCNPVDTSNALLDDPVPNIFTWRPFPPAG